MPLRSRVAATNPCSLRRDTRVAIEFIEHHADRLPLAVLVRVAREWDLFKPTQMAQVETGEGRPYDASLAGLGFYYALLPFGVAGIVIFRRRRIDQWFLLVPAGVVTVVSALVIALVRYRAPFEVCLVVLAAPGMVLLAQRLSGRQHQEAALASSDQAHAPVALHSEDFAQHALDEMVAQRRAVSHFAACRGQANDAVIAHLDAAVALEPLDRHGDGRRGNLKPVREHGRDHLTAFGLGLKNGLEVVLFRNVDCVFHGGAGFSLNASRSRRHPGRTRRSPNRVRFRPHPPPHDF